MKPNNIIAAVIPINDENRDAFVKLVMSMYLGERCICGRKFKTLDDLKHTVWHPHKTGRISHKECFEVNRIRKEVV